MPLRKAGVNMADLLVGNQVHFREDCPLSMVGGKIARITATRDYRFADDHIRSFELTFASKRRIYLTVASDAQGHYLSIARPLNATEQDEWFGRDALSFFTEPSSAKSIRCKADFAREGEWVGERYSKTVDWLMGSVKLDSARHAQEIHYSLLVNEAGDRALEIECPVIPDDPLFFVTIYRPMEDIERIVAAEEIAPPITTASPAIVAANDDVPPPQPEPSLMSAAPKQRMDFRRLEPSNEMLHVARPVRTASPPLVADDSEPERALPSFLLRREPEDYLALDQVIAPEPERVRLGLQAAQSLIAAAITRQVRIRDVLREMVGLTSALSDEVMVELPLSDADYRQLAMRYKLRPDHRIEIRARLEEELRDALLNLRS